MTAQLVDDWDDGLGVVLPDLRPVERICVTDGCRNTRTDWTLNCCPCLNRAAAKAAEEKLREQRRTASAKAAAARRRVARKRARNRLADLRWMLDAGEWPERACQRLDPPTTPAALARWLRNHDEPQLAARFDAIADKANRAKRKAAR